jgi:cytoskeletal protein RodZ
MTIGDKGHRKAEPTPSEGSVSARGPKVTEAAQSVGERLRTAREAKGFDYYRIERDTKIRAKYLAALERGDQAALPGDVYAKGFLRNYAQYLGMDGDEILEAWRREQAEAGGKRPLVSAPLPLRMANRRFVLLPNHFFMILLLVVVGAFGGYFGLQIVHLLQPITVDVSTPNSSRISVEADATTYLLSGTATAGTTVEISWDGQPPTRITVDSTGHWSYLANLHAGVNQFEITARDTGSQHHSETVVRLIDVPVSGSSPEAPQLVLSAPEDGTVFPNDTIEVTGKTAGVTTVTITPVYLGPPPLPGSEETAKPSPSPSPSSSGPVSVGTPTPTPLPTVRPTLPPTQPPTPVPTAYPTPTNGPSGSPGPAPVNKTVDIYGNFSVPIQLPPGQWLITVRGINGSGGVTPEVSRTVTINYSNVQVVVEITGAPVGQKGTFLRYWKNDGSGFVQLGKGKQFGVGSKLTIVGVKSVRVQTGCAVGTSVIVNGWPYTLSRYCTDQTWLFTATAPPKRVA